MVSPPRLQRHEICQKLSRYLSVPHRTPKPPFSMQWWCVDAVVVITGGWCVAKNKRNIHTEDATSHGEKIKEKKRDAEYRTRELRRYSLMVLPPTLQRHEFAQSIHATFLYPTARLPPLFDAVVVITGGWCVAKKKRNIHTEDTTSHGKKKKRCRVRVSNSRTST